MPTTITTDWHIGVKRNAGTTPASSLCLRGYLLEHLRANLDEGSDHLIAGDLFNDFTVDTYDLIRTYEILSTWLSSSKRMLALMRGNHDYHARALEKSSFDLLASILKAQFPSHVTVATDVTEWKQFTLVPHLPNNDILSLEIRKLADVRDRVMVFHANLENPFAAGSQHSLNVTAEQLDALTKNGNKVLFGHEHVPRTFRGAIVLGNAAPSSISDCLENDAKFIHRVVGLNVERTRTWTRADHYAEVDWTDLENAPEVDFIRVTGAATADQAAEVVGAVAALRKVSPAMVISNSVRIEGMADFDALAELSFDDVSKIDVLGMLLEELNEREKKTVKELLS